MPRTTEFVEGRIPPDRSFFKIGEVSRIVGVKPHVLRYWETEFRRLAPRKTNAGHRLYRRIDVEIALRLKQLLHQEGYKIEGARKKLAQETGDVLDAMDHGQQPTKLKELEIRQQALDAALLSIRKEVSDLLKLVGE